jgi:hypothetical protein
MLLGALGTWSAMHYHLLRTNDGFACVPKYRAGLSGTFVDVRDWSVTEWTEHPELALTLQQNNRTDILGETKVMGTTIRDAIKMVQ